MNTAPSIKEQFDVDEIRRQFPVLEREVKGHPLVYLDNAATAQKPQDVIDALVEYYSGYNANIHRGIHTLAEEATAAFEQARDKAAAFMNSEFREEVIFTSGTTDSINLVAYAWGRKFINQGDEMIVSGLEHHSNMVPWQILCEEKGATLKYIPIRENGELDLDVYASLLSSKTKFVSVGHASNALGTINPVKKMISMAHAAGALFLVDGAQSSVHLDIDVQDLDCDFFAFSSHKVYGPTGVGVLYGKRELLESMPPYKSGGEMVREVSLEKTTFNDLPYKFEAGTPNIADTIAFGYALDFVTKTGKLQIRKHEDDLLGYATERLQEIDGLKIIGNSANKLSVISFVVDKVHPQDIGILLDNKGIAVRTGHHCAQPVMDCFRIPGTTRASFAMYNTRKEVDILMAALVNAVKKLR